MSSFPACTVCNQQFSRKGPAPFLLPCLHAVCEVCVTSAAGGVISCSPCQRDVNLTETSLQKDVITEKEILHLTVKHHPELVLCTHEDDGNQAVCWCKECEGFFCENCQMVHNSFKGTRRHTVHNIGELEVDSFDEEKYCSVHPKFIADTMDEDCKMLTCLKCRREDHAGHRVVSVGEIADLARKKLTKLQADLKCTIGKRRANLAAAEKSLSSLEQKYTMLPDKITHTFLSLRTLIDQREKELQIELQQLKEKSGEEREKKIRSETCLKRCLIASDYVSKTLQYSTMYDLLELGILDEENPLNDDSSVSSVDSRTRPLPVFNTKGLEMIKSTLAKFGTIATENDIFTSHIEDKETQTDGDLTSQKLERLTKEIEQLKSSQENLIREKENAEDGLANLLERSPDLAEVGVDQSAATFKLQESLAGHFSESSECPLQDLEKDIKLVKRHRELEMMGEKAVKIWEDFSLTSKLKDRLQKERKDDVLIKRPGKEMTMPSSKARNSSTEVAMETSGEVAMESSDVPECSGSYVEPSDDRQTVHQETPRQEFEKDIECWEKNHREQVVKKENVDNILEELSRTNRLIEKLLEERKEGCLMKRQDELQREYSRQQAEIEKLKKQRLERRPLVHILSEWRSLPIEDIADRISSVLARQKVDMRFNIVTSLAKVAPNSRPLLVLCVNNSQLDTDVAHALKSIRVDDGVCMLVLHHKDQHDKAPKNSEKVLSAGGFLSPGAVADMVFWKKKGLYHSGQNDGAAEKIAGFLARHARP